jgi:hypothetical protein
MLDPLIVLSCLVLFSPVVVAAFSHPEVLMNLFRQRHEDGKAEKQNQLKSPTK